MLVSASPANPWSYISVYYISQACGECSLHTDCVRAYHYLHRSPVTHQCTKNAWQHVWIMHWGISFHRSKNWFFIHKVAIINMFSFGNNATRLVFQQKYIYLHDITLEFNIILLIFNVLTAVEYECDKCLWHIYTYNWKCTYIEDYNLDKFCQVHMA